MSPSRSDAPPYTRPCVRKRRCFDRRLPSTISLRLDRTRRSFDRRLPRLKLRTNAVGGIPRNIGRVWCSAGVESDSVFECHHRCLQHLTLQGHAHLSPARRSSCHCLPPIHISTVVVISNRNGGFHRRGLPRRSALPRRRPRARLEPHGQERLRPASLLGQSSREPSVRTLVGDGNVFGARSRVGNAE